MSRQAFSRCVLAGISATPLLGCDAVPTLIFSDSGAALVGTADAGDGSTDAQDATADIAFDVGCPGYPPVGASTCCGAVSCNGDCDARCSECTSKCQAPAVCCIRTTVTCHQPSFVCN